jgi:hypothetical protein
MRPDKRRAKSEGANLIASDDAAHFIEATAGLAVVSVSPHPRCDVPRGADVENLTARSIEEIHAGHRRQSTGC